MSDKSQSEKVTDLIDELLEQARTPEDQVKILRDCLENHCLQHPWADDELVESICENISNEYNLSWESENYDASLDLDVG